MFTVAAEFPPDVARDFLADAKILGTARLKKSRSGKKSCVLVDGWRDESLHQERTYTLDWEYKKKKG